VIATLVTLLIAVIAFIVAVVLVWTAIPGQYEERKVSVKGILSGTLLGIFALVIMYVAFGWRQIDPGRVGVVTSFGKIQGTIGPGLTWLPAIFNDVIVMDTRVQAYNFGKEGVEGEEQCPSGIEAFTQENQVARMCGVINYHIDPGYAAELYQNVGIDYFEKVIKHQADTEIKRDSRQFTTDVITAKRDELAAAALARLQVDVAPYHIVIDGIFISQIGLPETYLEAVNQKLIAGQNVEKERQNALAEQQKGIANANRVREEAQGQADANAAIDASLTQQLIQWQAIQKLNPNVNVMLVPSDQGFLFTLPVPSPTP